MEMSEGLLRPKDVPSNKPITNYAELYAIKRALEIFGHLSPTIHTDSQWSAGVCNQNWSVKAYPGLARLAKEVRQILAITEATIVWIPRHKNRKADHLATWASGYRKSI